MPGFDEVYSERQKQIKSFEFDEKVTAVFPDMIKRSVPGYNLIISNISMLTEKYAQPYTVCYDLGCSLGASTFAISEGINVDGCEIIAVDNSEAMINSLKEKLVGFRTGIPVQVLHEDITNLTFNKSSVNVLNFTLQFINPEKRADLLKKICDSTVQKGILILSEKLRFDHENRNEHQIELYHSFKKYNGYSDLEISQKRTALENVLIPESFETHKKRLLEAGYSKVDIWFQCFNFFSILAIK